MKYLIPLQRRKLFVLDYISPTNTVVILSEYKQPSSLLWRHIYWSTAFQPNNPPITEGRKILLLGFSFPNSLSNNCTELDHNKTTPLCVKNERTKKKKNESEFFCLYFDAKFCSILAKNRTMTNSELNDKQGAPCWGQCKLYIFLSFIFLKILYQLFFLFELNLKNRNRSVVRLLYWGKL